MAIEKVTPATPVDGLIEQEEQEEEEVKVSIKNPEAVSIETEDGGMLIDFDPQDEQMESEFNSNLVNFIDDQELEKLALS